MPSSFWSNTIWFILLGIATAFELIFIFTKVQKPKLVLALYLTVAGLAFAIELSVFASFNAYQYFPKIIPSSPYDDSVAANLFSQFSIAATALLIAVYNLKYYWYIIFAGAYGLIEELFIKLGIYKHNWYRTWMTIVGLLILFWMVKKIYTGSIKQISRIWRYIYIFLGLITLHAHLLWIFRLSKIFAFGENFYAVEGSKITPIASIYHLVVGGTIIALYFLKISWWWKATIALLLLAAHYFGYYFHLMIFKPGWLIPVSVFSILSIYLFIYFLDKLFDQA